MTTPAPRTETPCLTAFQKVVERRAGKSIGELRETTLSDARASWEKKHGRKLRFATNWPFVGRGNVMHGHTLPNSEVEAMVDEALGG